MSRVFLVEPIDRVDTSPAAEHGEVNYLFPDRVFSYDANKLYREIFEKLEAVHFDPETDMLCLSGTLMVVSLAVAACIARFGGVTILVYNGKTSTYLRRDVDPVTAS